MYMKNNKNSKMKTVPHKKSKIDRSQLLSYILAGLTIFWTFASVFGFIAYGRTSRKTTNNRTISASAQTTDSIATDGYLEIELPYLEGLSIYDGYNTITYSAPSLLIYNNSLSLKGVEEVSIESSSVLLSRALFYVRVPGSMGTNFQVEGVNITNNAPYNHHYSNLYDVDGIFLDYTFVHHADEYALYADIVLHVDYNGVMHDYSFSLVYGYPSRTPRLTRACYSLAFFGGTLELTTTKTFENTLGYGVPTAEALKYLRIVGTGNPDMAVTYELAYNNGYKQGKQVGVQEAINNAYDSGIEQGKVDGYNDGFSEGKAVGYEQGLDHANTYTFSKLLTAVFDVPVTAFSSLFDFELLGVNVHGFLLALFTAGLILCIIRFIL